MQTLYQKQTLAQALAYNKAKISCIPILYKDKIPTIKTWIPYQRVLPEESTIKKWFDNEDNHNIAVLTGNVSDLAVIDLDSKEAFIKLKTKAKWIVDNPIVETGRGYHIWVSLWEYPSTFAFDLEGSRCHVKANPGYVIAPPSMHVSGKEYKFLNGGNFKNRDTVDIQQIERAIAEAGGVRSSEKLQDAPITWASELCDKISTGGRNDSAVKLCGLLIRKFWYDPGLIKGLMLSWNAYYCDPPLPDREINYLVDTEIRRYLPRREDGVKSFKDKAGP